MWIKRKKYEELCKELEIAKKCQRSLEDQYSDMRRRYTEESNALTESYRARTKLEVENGQLKGAVANAERLLQERETRIDELNLLIAQMEEPECFENRSELPVHSEDDYQDLCIRLNEAQATIRTLMQMYGGL